MTDSKRPPVPSGLAAGGRGRTFWRDTVGTYTLDPHELRILAEACATLDEIDRVREALDEAPSLLAKGSMGQAVEHPLLGTLRSHRITFDKMIARLALPDSEGQAPQTTRQMASQRANDGRWATHRKTKGAS